MVDISIKAKYRWIAKLYTFINKQLFISYGKIELAPSKMWLIGLFYLPFVFLSYFDQTTPRLCPVFNLSGIPCISCGLTRGLASILRFDFQDAVFYHPFSLIVPLLLMAIFTAGFFSPKRTTIEVTGLKLVIVLSAVITSWLLKIIFVDQSYW